METEDTTGSFDSGGAGRQGWSLDDLPGALFLFDGDDLRGFNAAARDLLGLEAGADSAAVVAVLDPECLLRERLRQDADRSQPPLRLSVRSHRGEPLCLELHFAAQTGPDDGTTLVLAFDYSRWQDIEAQLQRRLVFERLLTEASAALMRSGNDRLDAAITDTLAAVGRFFGIDRAYVFLIDEAAGTQSNTHEWVASGITSEAPRLQGISLATYPWLLALLRDNQVFDYERIGDLPAEAVNERAEFEREGIQSILIVPLWRGAQLHGFVGFDSVRRQVDWGGDYVIGLRLMAQMLASALDARALSLLLHEQAFHDALTGLPNRKLLEDRFAQAIGRLQRDGGSVQLAVVDVDDFKRVNDSHGHAAGDLLLREMGRRMCAALRATDTVARMGGDEFVVLAQGSCGGSLGDLAQRLQSACAAPLDLDGLHIRAGLSIGLVETHAAGADFDGLLRSADAAMYRAKTEGKDRWVAADTAARTDATTA